jgi:GxxExxY protein
MKHEITEFSSFRFDIIHVAIALQDRLGTAHAEKVYHRTLLAALRKAGFKVQDQPELKLADAYGKVIQRYRPDLRVQRGEFSIFVEIKADPNGLQESYIRQAKSYLSTSQADRATMLINFANDQLPREERPERQNIFRGDL